MFVIRKFKYVVMRCTIYKLYKIWRKGKEFIIILLFWSTKGTVDKQSTSETPSYKNLFHMEIFF